MPATEGRGSARHLRWTRCHPVFRPICVIAGVPLPGREVPIHALVNDGLMTLFFLVVGLEIKRELMDGELSSVRSAVLPAIAALGGMLAGIGFTVALFIATLAFDGDPESLRQAKLGILFGSAAAGVAGMLALRLAPGIRAS